VVACERKHDTNNALISPEALVALNLLTLTSFSLFLLAAPPVVFEEFDIAVMPGVRDIVAGRDRRARRADTWCF
jgi:hypothetical protein